MNAAELNESRQLVQTGVVTAQLNATARLRRRGFLLEWITLGWNAGGVLVLAILTMQSGSVALLGFGLDSLVEIGASVIVIWQLAGTGMARSDFALRLIGVAFLVLAAYIGAQSGLALIAQHRAITSPGGVAWSAITAVVMFTLAAAKARTGKALANPVLSAEGRVTFVDGLLAVAVLVGLLLNAVLGWWWADPLAGLVIVAYAIREAYAIFAVGHEDSTP